MPIKEKKWTIKHSHTEHEIKLKDELKIHPILCKLLSQRGISTYEQAKSYFRPSLTEMHSPWLLKGMDSAVSRILEAIVNNEKILVYGDYDVDGTTSVAIVYDFLTGIYDKEKITYYIPDRYKEGYGLSKAGIDYAIENQFKLLITLDCGIKSSALIKEALEKGTETIICDHHLPDYEIPPAVAILNAKQTDCNYPYTDLCACGVGFKLIHALALKLELDQNAYLKYLEFVAIAIAADIVPITGENRLLAYHGLKQLNSNPCIGIKSLIEVSGLKGDVNISNLGFLIGPRINAAGRMDDAKKAVSLFLEKDQEKARHYASLLQEDNRSRKETDVNITDDAIQQIENNITEDQKKSIVVYSPDWHKGVIGIVASRLIERFFKPTIVLTKSGDVVAGSARSIPGFNIHDGLTKCKDLLLGFGGHYFAAGMTLLPENIDAFKNRFEEIVSSSLSEDAYTPTIEIDAELMLSDLTSSFHNILLQMEPFGPENQQPVFCVRNLQDKGSKIVKDLHVRFQVQQNGTVFSGICFNRAEKFKRLDLSQPLDLVFTLEENVFNGNVSLQLKVIDFATSVEKRKDE